MARNLFDEKKQRRNEKCMILGVFIDKVGKIHAINRVRVLFSLLTLLDFNVLCVDEGEALLFPSILRNLFYQNITEK
jgi:hypothetical protein